MIDRDKLLGADDDFDRFETEEEEDDFLGDVDESRAGGGLFLGMTPVERMFISIFLFMNVAVLGLALLLATNRIRF